MCQLPRNQFREIRGTTNPLQRNWEGLFHVGGYRPECRTQSAERRTQKAIGCHSRGWVGCVLRSAFCALAMVSVRVPATIANWGPAFDALGVAVTVYNTVQAQASPSPSVYVGGDGAETLPVDSSNPVHRAAAAAAQRAGRRAYFSGRCPNTIPPRRGLGSSAAAMRGRAVGGHQQLG